MKDGIGPDMTREDHANVSSQLFASYWLDNDGIKKAIRSCNDKTGYIIDPHGAIGYKAWKDIYNGGMEKLIAGEKPDFNLPGLTPNIPDWANAVVNKSAVGVVLETASPAKFGQIVTDAIGKEPPMPDRLEAVMRLPDNAIPMENDYNQFKDWLIANL